MKVHGIDSELWWLANADEIRASRGTPLQEIMKILKENFHFFEMPTEIPKGTDGFSLKHGSFFDGTDLIAIREIVIYNAAVHITASGSTDNADKVFQKLTEIFIGIGMKAPTTPPIKFYRSTIVCDLDRSIDSLLNKCEIIAKMLQAKSCLPDIPMQTSGIAFSSDPTAIPAQMAAYNPTLFSINRKTDVSFSTNRCTCFANMKTEDHLAALAEIERLI